MERSLAYVHMRPWIGLIWLLVGALTHAGELPDVRRIAANFHHSSWTAKDGISGESPWLAQTSDGWLWLGGRSGLLRFDGVTFERVDIGAPQARASDSIYSFYADESGGLWIGFDHGGISRRLADGSFEHYGAAEGLPATSVQTLTQDSSGRMWAGTLSGLMRFDGKRWHKVGEDLNYPAGKVFAVYADQNGTVWSSHEAGIFYLAVDETSFHRMDRKVSAGGAALFQSPDGRMWYIDAKGVHLLTAQRPSKPRTPRSTAREWSTAMFDRYGDLWTTYPKLMRIPAPVPDEILFSNLAGVDSFTSSDGLSASMAVSLIEDREGTIWAATPGGLDRFRRTNVHKVAFDAEVPYYVGIVPAEGGAILAGMYMGNVPGAKDGLWKYDGRLVHEAPGIIPAVTAIHRDATGLVWIGTSQGVWKRSSTGGLQKLPELPEGIRKALINSLTVDAAGDLWLAPASAMVHRFRLGTWEPLGNIETLPQQPVITQTLGADGRMWFGYADGRVAAVEHDRVSMFGPRDGLGRRVSAISAAREVVVAAGDDGVFVLNKGRFHRLVADDKVALSSVTGILQLDNGDLWLNGFRGGVHIDGRRLLVARQSDNYAVPLDVFDDEDGYPGIARQVRPIPTIAQGSDGKLWFSGTLSAGWLHPGRIARNTIPPSVNVRSVSANKRVYKSATQTQLPKGTRDLQVSYTALSLAMPEKTRFRYRLRGYDSAWTDAGTRREAFFTNLSPGKYRFEVMAANASGVWSETGDSVGIVIPALFTQTRTFVALCVAAALALLWGVTALRMRQLTLRERSRLQVRLVERERIARELHDTLLQGVQGLMLNFQAVAEQIGPHEQPRASMEHALERADALLIEGRERVKNLRNAHEVPGSLRQALLDAAGQMSGEGSPRVQVIENGDTRTVHPTVREEVERIAIEALSNALRHAQATKIDVEFLHERKRLRMVVRDDGRGIEESVLRAGREGHFGLLGMRERAKRIRGRLAISRRPGAGTEVILLVPANVAFVRRRSWLGVFPLSRLAGPHELS